MAQFPPFRSALLFDSVSDKIAVTTGRVVIASGKECADKMAKVFNTDGYCDADFNYMIELSDRLKKLRLWWMSESILRLIEQDSMERPLF